jgi:hypothetical protein
MKAERYLRPRIPLFLLAIGFAGSCVFASGADFIPRPLKNGAFLEVFAAYEYDEYPNNFSSLAWSDTFLREKLTFYSDGYFYHPRFLQYHVSLSGALKQEDYEANYLEPQGWRHGTGLEYDTRFYFLPEHPYNLELFALQYQPLFKEQAATQRDSLQTSRGGLFRYRKKPVFFSTRLTDNTTQSGSYTTDVRRLGMDAQYFQRYAGGNQLSFNGAYNPSRFSNSLGLHGNSEEYLLGNLVDLQRVRLSSSLTQNNSDQENTSSGSFKSEQLAWYEILNAYLPWNFRTDLSYRQQNNSTENTTAGSSQSDRLTDESRIVQLDVIHHLFQSLDTVYSFLDSSRATTGGDTTFSSNTLSMSYTKLIPNGRLAVGVNYGRGLTDTQGQADILNEPHTAVAVPGSFTLNQPNVDPQTVVVYLKSPLPPFNTVRLVESVHYTLTSTSNTFDVNVLALPALFVVPGTYDFLVSYSISAGDFRLRSDNIGYNASVELFDTMLTPYYSHAEVRSTLLTGSFPGTPPDSTTDTLGVRFHRGPLRALGEYQRFDWEISPYRSWRTEVQYVGPVSPTARLYATLSYLDKYYPEGNSMNSNGAYTDRAATASGSYQKQVPDRNLALSAGGSYTRLQGQVDGNAYSLNSSLTWKVGKLDLIAGASAYNSDTQGTTGFVNSRFHEYYYLNIRRVFF